MKTKVPMKFRGTDRLQKLFAKRSRWIKREMARDPGGYYVHSDDVNATKFCLVGGMQRCYPMSARSKVRSRLTAALKKLYPTKNWLSLTEFNDHRSTRFEDVFRVIKKAKV